MIAGDVFVTPHAVEQFRSRIPGMAGLRYEAALARIIRALHADTVSIRPTANQQAVCIRVRGEVNFRAVVSTGSGDKPAVVTILRSGK